MTAVEGRLPCISIMILLLLSCNHLPAYYRYDLSSQAQEEKLEIQLILLANLVECLVKEKVLKM